MADIKKKLSIWKCETSTSHCKNVYSISLTENVGEILPFQFGNIILVFLSVANGHLKVLHFNQETDKVSLMPKVFMTKIWLLRLGCL